MKATLSIAAFCLMVCLSLATNLAHAYQGGSYDGQPVATPISDAPSDGEAGRIVLDNTIGVSRTSAADFGPLIHLDGVFGDHQGWDGNLFQVETFIPIHLDTGRNLFFVSLSGLTDEDGNGIGNFGVGYRVHSSSLDRIFSISAWYDIDDGHSTSYTRGGVSISSLGKYLDFIANGYSIIGRDSNVVATGTSGVPTFVGNNVLVSSAQTIESAYSGGDASIGGPVPILGRYGTKAYVGAHYLKTPGRKEAIGGDLRLQQRLNDDVVIDLTYAWDDVFKSNMYVNVAFTLPTGKRNGWMKRWLKHRPVRHRLADRVYRNRRIPVKLATHLLTPEIALDPRDGLPINIHYINETGAAGGTGTVEDPAQSFAAIEGMTVGNRNAFDIVLVSGAAFQTTGTYTVGPNQRLLGAGLSQTVLTSLGGLALPGTPTGVTPILTNNLGGDVLALSSGSEISGFIVDGSGTGRPIVGNSIMGFNVNNNTLRNSVDHSMVLMNAGGTFAGGNPGIITLNNVSGNPTDGIQIINNTPGTVLDLVMTSNIANDNGTNVGGTGIRIEAHGAGTVINADPSVVAGTALSGNTANNNGTGIRLLTSLSGLINASIDGNTMMGNTDPSSGLSLSSDGAGSNIVISSMVNNRITGNLGYGINGAATNGGGITINSMTGNDVSGNVVGNMRLSAFGIGSTINANIGSPGGAINNFAGSTTGAGIELFSTNGNMFVAVQNNQIATAASPNSTYGILGSFDGGVASITIGGGAGAGNMIVSDGTSMNTGVALVFANTAGTLFTPQLNTGNNIITGIGSIGMSISNQNAMTNLTITSTNDMITNNGTTGLVVTNNSTNVSGQVSLFAEGGSYSNTSNGNGIHLIANNSGVLSAAFNNVTANDNGDFFFFLGNGNGLQFDVNGTSTGNLTVLSSVFTGNNHNVFFGTRTNGDGIQINVNRNDALAANLDNVAIGVAGQGNVLSGNDGDGLEINHNSTGIITNLNVTANTIQGNGQRGIFYDSQLTAETATPINATFSQNVVQFNSREGFLADIRDFFGTRAAPGVINITNQNVFSFNGRDGISIVTDTDRVRPTLTGNQIQDQNAVTFNHGGAGVIAHDPNAAAFATQLQAGTFMANPNGRYLSTLTDIAVNVVVNNNQIISNGTAGIGGSDAGFSVAVGTDTYVALDFQNNRVETNNGADFRASSFLSDTNTPNTTFNAGIDTLTLDGIAQLDMRFLGNRMNTVDIGTTNATMTNADAGKNFLGPNPWTTAGDTFDNRPVFFYRVDNSGALDATNIIISGGVPSSASAAFTAGRFNLDAGAVFGSAGFVTDQPLP